MLGAYAEERQTIGSVSILLFADVGQEAACACAVNVSQTFAG
jgi:hypothetical protein